MTPEQAMAAAEEFMVRTMRGSDDLNLRIASWRTREYDNAFVFSYASFDRTTGRPAPVQPAGGTPILVPKDGSRVRGFWPFDEELAEYGLMPPRSEQVVVLTSSSDAGSTARALRDLAAMPLSEALRTARDVAAGRSFEIAIRDASEGDRMAAAFRERGTPAVSVERCTTVLRTYLGRPWPMPEWMPRMLDRIRLWSDPIDRYLDGRIDLRALGPELFRLDHDLTDAEGAEYDAIDPAARQEWKVLREGLCSVLLGMQFPFEMEEVHGIEACVDREEEERFRGTMRGLRSDMDALVLRHAITEDRPTPLASRKTGTTSVEAVVG